MLILLALLGGLGWGQFVGDSACADCHRNIVKRYGATTMSKEGVLCENCHGEARMHAKGAGRLEVPTALEPVERDAVCAQCHFRGAGRVARAGRDVRRFRAGQTLTRYAASFVFVDAPEEGGGAVEELAASRCKQKAGADLWCGSCHDSHSGAVDRSACLGCHAAKQCGRGKDCSGCHMAGGDHRIGRRKTARRAGGWQVRPFTAADGGARELGLQYYGLWQKSGDGRQREEAARLLTGLLNKDAAVGRALENLKKAGTKKR
ncbi:MAG: cytochrome c3 family protein [Bryobacterales bacterium]|nr:cytochrome c3 family protein [Bryobacterales bacterium]